MPATNTTGKIADIITTQTINLLRLSAGQLRPILEILRALEVELLRDLEVATGKTDFTLTRLRALLRQTRETIATAYQQITVQNESGLVDVAKITVQQTVAAMNAAIGAKIVSVGWSRQQVARIATDTIIRGSFAADWWEQQGEALQTRFENEMRMGLLRGETIQQLASRVRGTKERNYMDGLMIPARQKAETLVRTSALGVSNLARLDTFAENDNVVRGVQWVSVLDNRTTLQCMALDGKVWEYPNGDGDAAYAEYVPVGHDKKFEPPPIHWNCRSTVVPLTYSWEELAAAHGNSEMAKLADEIPERTRESMDGQVAESMTFDEWLQTKSVDFQNEVLGPQRAQLWRDGYLTLDALTDQSNNPITVADLREQLGYEPPTPVTPTFNPEEPPSPEVKAEMRESEIEDVAARIPGEEGHANAAEFVTLDDGIKGVFKPTSGENHELRSTVPDRFAEREVAASDIADMIGLGDLVPPTVMRDVEGYGKGSFQQFVANARAEGSLPDLDDAKRAAAFDYLIGNTDRHGGNWLTNDAGKIALIDNGLSFPSKSWEFMSGIFWRAAAERWTIPPVVKDWLQARSAIVAYLKAAGFRETEIAALDARFNALGGATRFDELGFRW